MAKKDEVRQEAARVAAAYGVKVVYRNDAGEFFLNKSLALASVDRVEKRVEVFDVNERVKGVMNGKD